MADEFSELINVTFVDQTSYTPDTGSDVVGTPIEHCWGEVNRVNVFDIKTFLATYPEAHPVGAVNPNVEYLKPWAQLRRALKARTPAVETFRVQGNWKYEQLNMTAAEEDAEFVTVQSATKFATTGCDLSLSMRYPGRPPQSGAYAEYVTFKVVAVLQEASLSTLGNPTAAIDIKVYGVTATNIEDLLESHIGNFEPASVQDGQSFYIVSVLARDSKIFDMSVISVPELFATIQVFTHTFEPLDMPVAVTAAQFKTAVINSFGDSEKTTATILLAPLNGDSELNAELGNIVATRKNVNFVVGLPLDTVFTEANIETFLTTGLPNASYDMFTHFIAGREVFSILGKQIFMDCTAGYAGAVCRVAKDVRINQMPSARTYGSFDGTITESLLMDAVLRLHKLGVNSVFTSNVGAQIFGIRSRHPRMTSFFAKSNVSRVTARFLRVVYPVIYEVIHTETVSDPTNLAILEGNLSRIVNTFIAQGNIKPESLVDLSNNSDEESNSGEILNINFELWYKKLTEKVNIKIIATDSSVTTNIT